MHQFPEERMDTRTYKRLCPSFLTDSLSEDQLDSIV